MNHGLATNGARPTRAIIKLFAVVVLVAVTSQLAIASAFIYLSYRSAEENFRTNLDLLLSARSELLAPLVWRLQYDELDKVMESMLVEGTLSRIVVFDETGAAIRSLTGGGEGGTQVATQRVDLLYRNGLIQERAGVVEVDAITGQIASRALSQLSYVVVAALLSTFCIVSVTWAAVQNLFGKPLGVLLNAISRSRGGEASVRVPERPADEVGELFSAFNGLMGRVEDSTLALLEANATLQRLSLTDDLTGLLNRRAVRNHFERESAGGMALLFLDIDRFKAANDLLGHQGADTLLKMFAERIRTAVGSSGEVFRMSGDEFLVVLNQCTSEQEALQRSESFRETLSEPYRIGDTVFTMTLSIGVLKVDSGLRDIDETLGIVDMALYMAKSGGRSRSILVSEAMIFNAKERLTLERELPYALATEQFEVHLQPKIDIMTGQLVGAEALSRWRHPQRGLILPGQFMPLIERSGFSVEHGLLVTRKACAAAAACQTALGYPLPISINASPQQLVHGKFWMTLTHQLMANNLLPSSIEIEVTENDLFSDLEEAKKLLQDYRNSGGRVALDDFGTGYSSLAYLTDLPIDVVKLDRAFVQRATREEASAAVVRAIVNICTEMGVDIVAEGIETVEEEDVVRRCGVYLMQGYRYGTPIPIKDFVRAWQTRIGTRASLT